MRPRRGKKRHEELGHFTGQLRLRLRCLQASLAERFVCSSGSALLRRLIKPNEKLDGNFLVLSRVEEHSIIPPDGDAASHHSFAVIRQLQGPTMANELRGRQLAWEGNLSAYVDPTDSQATDRVHSLLARLSQGSGAVDLTELERWGAAKDVMPYTSPRDAVATIMKWTDRFGVASPILERLCLFAQVGADAFRSIDTLTMASDGIVITCVLEGEGLFSAAEDLTAMLTPLLHMPIHTVVVNSTADGRGQLSATLPLRNALLSSDRRSLRCFVLVRAGSVRSLVKREPQAS